MMEDHIQFSLAGYLSASSTLSPSHNDMRVPENHLKRPNDHSSGVAFIRWLHFLSKRRTLA